MNPTDQPQLKIGEVYYLKRVSVYHQCTLLSLRSPDDFEHTAKVSYYSDGEPVICRQSELITEEQYKAVLKQRAKEAYERDLPVRRERAKAKYADIITHWNNGLRTSQEIAPLIRGMIKFAEPISVRACSQMIAAAKRWGLIEPAKEQDAKPPTD